MVLLYLTITKDGKTFNSWAAYRNTRGAAGVTIGCHGGIATKPAFTVTYV
jgi:hypothetical protein